MQHKRQPRGFTLVELLIVIAILGAVAATAFTSLKGQTGDKAPGFARQILAAVHEARQTAISRNLYTRLKLTPVQTGGEVNIVQTEVIDPNNPGTFIPLSPTVKSPSAMQLCQPAASLVNTTTTPTSCTSTTINYICFSPTGPVSVTTGATCPGGSPGTGATLFARTLDDRKHYKIMIFSQTGLPRLVDQW